MKRHYVLNRKIHNRVRSVMFITLAFLLGVLFPLPGHAQTKVKIFLMAGQSNMQGHASIAQLEKILCAKNALDLPDDSKGCYDSIASQEERLFQTISDFYWTGSNYGYGYDSIQARLESQSIDTNYLVDGRLLSPFDRVQVVNFTVNRNNGEIGNPAVWSGSLTTGFGASKNEYGSELLFGHYMAQYISDDIVLVKVVQGGTSLYVDWRSPSMEDRLGVADVPSYYPLLKEYLDSVITNIGDFIPKYQDQDVEMEVAGFVWFQGWNDAINSTYAAAYEQNLTDFITDLRNDLDMPELPVVIGKTQNDGTSGLIVQQAQAAVGQNIGRAASVVTNDLSNYYHFDSGSHLIIGTRMGTEMTDLLESLPLPWKSEDINNPVLPGTATYKEGTYTIKGSGNNIWDHSDQFHYVHQPFSGDGEIIVRVDSVSNSSASAKSGLMIRETLAPDSKNAMMLAKPNMETSFNWRVTTGGGTKSYGSGGYSPVWLKLKRSGNIFTGYKSSDGINWIKVRDASIDMSADANIGLAVTSSDVDSVCTAIFNTISIHNSPSTPTDLKAEVLSSFSISLCWTDNSDDETGFELERSLSADSGFVQIATFSPNETSYLDSNLTPGTTYYYKLKAYNENGNSGYTNTIITKPDMPAPWVSEDIGTPALSGQAVYVDGIYTVSGSGTDIWNSSDQFRFVYQSLVGDGEIIAKVESLTRTDQWAKAGIMIRETQASGSKQISLVVSPDRGLAFQRRVADDNRSYYTSSSGSTPIWLKLKRSGTYFIGFKSDDGTNWEKIDSLTIDMDVESSIGLAVTSHNVDSICTAVFSNVSVNKSPQSPTFLISNLYSSDADNLSWTDNSDDETGFLVERSLDPDSGFTPIAVIDSSITSYLDTNLLTDTAYYFRVRAYNSMGNSGYTNVSEIRTGFPAPWINDDIGNPAFSGQAVYQDGSFIITGSGNDIWNTSDQFHYMYQPFSGDGEIIARVDSVSNANTWSKAGVMIRETLAPDSRHAMMIARPDMKTFFQRRVTTGGGGKSTTTGGSSPVWLKLTRKDSVFTAYRSADGINWLKVGEDTIDMPADVNVGLVVTSHNVDSICTASFSDVTIHQGNQILNMPRLAGDFDRSGFANVIDVTSTPVSTEAFHPYTGLYGKNIIAQLQNLLHQEGLLFQLSLYLMTFYKLKNCFRPGI